MNKQPESFALIDPIILLHRTPFADPPKSIFNIFRSINFFKEGKKDIDESLQDDKNQSRDPCFPSQYATLSEALPPISAVNNKKDAEISVDKIAVKNETENLDDGLKEITDFEKKTEDLTERTESLPLEKNDSDVPEETGDIFSISLQSPNEDYEELLHEVNDINKDLVYLGVFSPEQSPVAYSFPRSSAESDLDLQSLPQKLGKSYKWQEKLAEDNRNLEESRFQIHEELLKKDEELADMQKYVETLENKLSVVVKEQKSLMEQLERGLTDSHEMNSNQTNDEIMRLKMELCRLQTERAEIEVQRLNTGSEKIVIVEKQESLQRDYEKALLEIKNLKELNNQLEIDLTKVSAENSSLRESEIELENLQSQLVHLEETHKEDREKIKGVLQEKKILEEEIDSLRGLMEEQTLATQEYRKKYRQAQERVEELMRDLDKKENDIETIRNGSAIEIRTIKAQCQEKISGMEALENYNKDLLARLNDSKHDRELLQQNAEEMKRQINHVVETNNVLQASLDVERQARKADSDELQKLQRIIMESELKVSSLKDDKIDLQKKIVRFEENITALQKRLTEKQNELAEASEALDTVREDAARQLARTKERSEAVRRYLELQIGDLERDVMTARVAVKVAHKDRDEVRKRLQAQIDNLGEALEIGQSRWRALHAHVAKLRKSLAPYVPRQFIEYDVRVPVLSTQKVTKSEQSQTAETGAQPKRSRASLEID